MSHPYVCLARILILQDFEAPDMWLLGNIMRANICFYSLIYVVNISNSFVCWSADFKGSRQRSDQ
jgi:hypothetical protein